MGSNVTHPPGLEDHVGHQADYTNTKDVVVPELVDTLEWVLESPPNVHQFDEPPVSLSVILKPSHNNNPRLLSKSST